jgi:hypothetical protein
MHTDIFEIELRMALDRLPVTLVNKWFDYLFSKEDLTITWKLIRIIYNEVHRSEILPNWITSIICEFLWKQILRKMMIVYQYVQVVCESISFLDRFQQQDSFLDIDCYYRIVWGSSTKLFENKTANISYLFSSSYTS